MKAQTPTHFKVIDNNGDIDHKELNKELFSKLDVDFWHNL